MIQAEEDSGNAGRIDGQISTRESFGHEVRGLIVFLRLIFSHLSDTPIDEGQHHEKEIFGTKITKEFHGSGQPLPHSLKGNDECNTAVNQGLHTVLQEGFYSF